MNAIPIKTHIKSLMLMLLVVSLPAAGVVDIREFSSVEKRERYHDLIEELRCPKCQNQNLAGSDSPIAEDLREELYQQLEAGRTDKEIKSFMVNRYGDYVLYRPPVQDNTLILWWGPPGVLGIGVIVVLALVWRRRRLLQKSSGADELSAEEQARLDRLLAQADDAPNDSLTDSNDSPVHTDEER